MIYADDKVKQRLFQHSRVPYSKINDPIWPVFWTCLRIHPCPPYLQISGRTDQNWMSYADDNAKQRLFQQSRDVTLWLMILSCQFLNILEFIHIHLICRFQEELIKTECLMLTTKSNRCFFSNQGDITLRLMIPSGPFSILSEISFMSTLSASFKNIRSKLNELC